MINLVRKRFSRSWSWSRSRTASKIARREEVAGAGAGDAIEWELRPGGMLVQKREIQKNEEEQLYITIRVSTVSSSQFCHQISVLPTSTFRELKVLMSILTKMEPAAQRMVFRGKEREDDEHLHMVGVRDGDKLLLLEDYSHKTAATAFHYCRTIRV
ncbi:BAG family molecular chaperone regulator 4-like [Andrographis paniculata]|uniref:BAG family molecular chaperone regulator 4-like n=1 Tax=Andrographis paniculata TaxID=175694 RepID=UPI0021E802CA|nr:BAG family molecular chaperone regulator 4-like [Andrographis paniculata]